MLHAPQQASRSPQPIPFGLELGDASGPLLGATSPEIHALRQFCSPALRSIALTPFVQQLLLEVF